MNEDLWAKGIVETAHGPVALPGMTKADAENLPRVETHKGPSDTRFKIEALEIAHTPFAGQIQFGCSKLKPGRTAVDLFIEPNYSRKLYGKEYATAEELQYLEFLFETFLGSANHSQTRPWGSIAIGDDPWTHDASIILWYRE
jgi:hypothetical protein